MSVAVNQAPQSAVDRLRHAQQLRMQADATELQALADLAGEHGWTSTDELDVNGQRAVRIGADGYCFGGGVTAARSGSHQRDLGHSSDLADP